MLFELRLESSTFLMGSLLFGHFGEQQENALLLMLFTVKSPCPWPALSSHLSTPPFLLCSLSMLLFFPPDWVALYQSPSFHCPRVSLSALYCLQPVLAAPLPQIILHNTHGLPNKALDLTTTAYSARLEWAWCTISDFVAKCMHGMSVKWSDLLNNFSDEA